MSTLPPVAVAGASGFVGRRLVGALLAAGHPVRALVRDGASAPAGSVAVRWEARSPPASDAFAGVAAVVYAAACIPERFDDLDLAQDCVSVNALAPLACARAAATAGVARFVYVSTGNLYRPQTRPVREDDPIDPVGRAATYLGSKALGDLWVRAFDGTRGLRTAVVRPSTIYGPGMGRGVVRTFVEQLALGKPVRIADGGRHAADLVWVDDVVAALVQAVGSPATGPFNVGSGTATSTLDLARCVAELLGQGAHLLEIAPASDGAPESFGALDITRARELLGYVPTPLADGLAATLRALGLRS